MKSRAVAIVLGLSLVFVALAVWLHQRPSTASAFIRRALPERTLTRGRAAELLRGEARFSRPIVVQFTLGKTFFNGTGMTEPDALYRVLRRAGFVRSKVIEYGDLDVQLTPDAQRQLGAVGGEIRDLGIGGAEIREGRHANLPLGRRELIEITGITHEGSAARVEFTYRVALNDMGRKLRANLGNDAPSVMAAARVDSFDEGQVQTGRAIMRLYDDGWRVVRE